MKGCWGVGGGWEEKGEEEAVLVAAVFPPRDVTALSHSSPSKNWVANDFRLVDFRFPARWPQNWGMIMDVLGD